MLLKIIVQLPYPFYKWPKVDRSARLGEQAWTSASPSQSTTNYLRRKTPTNQTHPHYLQNLLHPGLQVLLVLLSSSVLIWACRQTTSIETQLLLLLFLLLPLPLLLLLCPLPLLLLLLSLLPLLLPLLSLLDMVMKRVEEIGGIWNRNWQNKLNLLNNFVLKRYYYHFNNNYYHYYRMTMMVNMIIGLLMINV